MRISLLFILGALFSSPLFTGQVAAQFIKINGHDAHPSRILAKVKAGVDADAVQQRQSAGGFRVKQKIDLVPGLVVLEKPELQTRQQAEGAEDELAQEIVAEIERLKATGLYEYVEPDYNRKPSLEPNDLQYRNGTLWGLKNSGQFGGVPGADINAVSAWDLSTGSTNIIVAVIDTGVNYNHVELRPQMWVNPGEVAGNGIDDDLNGYVDDIYGIDAIVRNGDPMDDDGHGTHVSGTIGAAANDGNGHVGVAWKVRLMGLRFIGAFGGSISDELACIDYAVANGAKIINASYGSQQFSQAEYNAINTARSKGVLFVAAAGNDGTDNDSIPHYPSNYDLDNLVSVAALDRRDRLAVFSNYGRVSVDIGAPGVDIYSTWIGSDRAYNIISGTSMATPHIVGGAAVLWSVNTNLGYAEIRQRLLTGTTKIPALTGRTTTEGRLNLFRAMAGNVDGIMEVFFLPGAGSALRAGTNAIVEISISDDFPVTNATINATFNSVSVPFLNNGQAPDRAAGDGVYTGTLAVPDFAGNYPFAVTITAPGKTNYSTNFTYRAVNAPANDNFENSEKIPSEGGSYVVDNSLATLQPGEDNPPHGGVPTASKSVWWSYSTATAVRVIADTAGSDPAVVIAVYTNNTLTARGEVVSATPAGPGKQPYVFFDARPGVTYHIAIASMSDDSGGEVNLRVEPNGVPDDKAPIVTVNEPVSGTVIESASDLVTLRGTAFDPLPNSSGVDAVNVRMNDEPVPVRANGTTNWSIIRSLQIGINQAEVTAVDRAGNVSLPRTITIFYRQPGVPNDLFANAQVLTGTNNVIRASTVGATREFNEPLHAGNEGGHSIWYTFTPTADGVVVISTADSSFDTLLAVYTGSNLSDLNLIAAGDDLPGSDGSEVTFGVRAGETYRIAVDGYAGSSGELVLSYFFRPTNVYRFTATAGTGGTVTPTEGDFPLNSAVTVTAIPDQEHQFVRWETSDGAFLSDRNPLTITITGPVSVRAVFGPREFTEGFESGTFNQLPWEMNPAGGWVIQSDVVSQGRYAASSGVTAHRQSKSLILKRNTAAGLGSFEFLVSSEAQYDVLRFFLNGLELGAWSGTDVTDFRLFTFHLPDGENTLEWRYTKDSVISRGLDAAFIDNIDLPTGAPSPGVQPQLTISENREIRVTASPNRAYAVEASSDLQTWTVVAERSTNASGEFTFTEPLIPGVTARFYRVVSR